MIDKLREEYLKAGLLVAPEDQESYAQEQGLIVKDFANGAKFFGVQRIIEDERAASLNASFAAGGAWDKPQKEGAHHLLEHLMFSDNLQNFLVKNLIWFNGTTQHDLVKLAFSGYFNREHTDFSLPVTLPKIFAEIANPEKLKEENGIEKEKEVILNELSLYNSSVSERAREYLDAQLYPAENPYSRKVIGNEASIKGLQMADVEEVLHSHFGSNNLVVSVLANGKGGELDYLAQQIQAEVEKFPNYQKPQNSFDFDKGNLTKAFDANLRKINLDDLKNKLVEMSLTWIDELEIYSAQSIASNYVLRSFMDKVFLRLRNLGLAYRIDSESFVLSPAKRIIRIFMVTSNDNIDQKWQLFEETIYGMLEHLLSAKDELLELMRTETLRQKIVPMHQHDKLNMTLSNYHNFGLLSNFQNIYSLYLNSEENSMFEYIKKLQNMPALKLIIGDLPQTVLTV